MGGKTSPLLFSEAQSDSETDKMYFPLPGIHQKSKGRIEHKEISKKKT